MENEVPILCASKICKSFGKNEVLKSIDFDIMPGEIHALIGENGAGKSTLLKILFGVHRQTSGEVMINGKCVCFNSPLDAKTHGIAMIHQEPLAFQDLSIMENIFMGHIKNNKKILIDWNQLEEEADKVLKALGLTFSPRQKMIGISVAEQQLVEIGAALVSDAKIIFMDEPTASLTPDEVNNLLSIIKKLKEQGKSIVYISHRLEEIKEIADRVTVLRDGNLIGTYKNSDLTQSDMISLMIGHKLNKESRKQTVRVYEEPYFQAKGIGIPGIFEDISFDVRKGEVLGIAGLMGAGRTEVARAIFGITPIEKGEILINGKKVEIKSPADAIKNGIALVPEDRQGLGLFLNKTIAFNSTFMIPKKITKALGWLDKNQEKNISEEYAKRFKTKFTSVDQNVGDLSGGNQQKINLAKWIATDPQVLILDEPTRGIDIGAKEEVYKIIEQLAEEGKCIIMISSELDEILSLSDRVMVMYEGKQTALINKEDLSEMKVLSAAHDYVMQ